MRPEEETKMDRAWIEHNEIQAEAWELQKNYCQDVPQPQEMMHLYRPMKFKKLRGREHVIKKQKMECAEVSSFRHSLLFGVKKLSVQYDKPMTFHDLIGPRGESEEGDDSPSAGLLTSDRPIEVYSQYIAFHKMRGQVLVGGLGLGMAAEMILAMADKVLSVTVVEINENLIKLIKPQIDPRINIVHANLFEFLRSGHDAGLGRHTFTFPNKWGGLHGIIFNSAYFDIWYGTGESTWQSTVVPLYRFARKAGINNLGAWGEHEMRGQLVSALYARTRMEEKYATWKPYKVFINGAKKVLGNSGPPWDTADPGRKAEIVELIKLYIEQVGSPKWEETFDWEAA